MNDQKTNSPISFEQLWEKSEAVATKTITKNCPDICDDLVDLIKEFKDLYSTEVSPTIQILMKSKKMGEVLFKLSEISLRENINVYTALQNEVLFEELLSNSQKTDT